MKKTVKILTLLALLMFVRGPVYSSEEEAAATKKSAKQAEDVASVEKSTAEDLLDMDLAELLEMEITVASYEAKSLREQPGIITVITREQIERTGARDLIDILNLVPGFRFAGDAEGNIGLGIRGLWANEGKVLILIDGLEMNENLYGAPSFSQHYSADLIEQVEIIRGPGSAMYGGVAELAVIKITSRGKSQEGVFLSGSLSYNRGEWSQKYDAVAGNQFEDWGYSFSGSFLDGNRSNEKQIDAYGTIYDQSKVGEMDDPYFYNVGLNYKGLELRHIEDHYGYHLGDYYGWVTPSRQYYDAMISEIKYTWKINDNLTFIPKITRKYHDGWNNILDFNSGERGDHVVFGERWTYNLIGKYKLGESLLTFGAEYYEDEGSVPERMGDDYFFYRSDRMKFYNKSLFGQYETPTDLGDLVVGARLEDHNFAGSKLVPRMGLTKVWDKFHFKALYSEAFRTPNIEIINYSVNGNLDAIAGGDPTGPDITSESTTAYELETGYKFNDQVYWAGNIFHVKVEDPIIYTLSPEGYNNGNPVSSYGLETELRVIPEWGDIKIGYGLYIADQTGGPDWATDDDHRTMGFPNHQISYDVTYNVTKNISLNCNGFITSSTRSHKGYDADDEAIYHSYDPQCIMNIFLAYKKDHLTVGVGVSDLFNEKELYIPSYKNWSGAIPSMSREFFIKASYEF